MWVCLGKDVAVRLRRLHQMLYVAVLVVSVLVSLKAHLLADLRFPPPWTDESGYLWQSINLAQHGTLFAPELNPERVIMWTVPGYQVFMGIVFMGVPPSLEVARAVSWLLALVAYVELLWLFRGRAPRLLIIIAVSWWYLGAHFVVLGNTARMEALQLPLVLAAFACLEMNRPYAAVALLLLSCLVHPNGVIFLCGGVAYVLWRGMYRSSPPQLDRVLLVLSIACIAGYVIFALRHWEALLHEWAWQFGFKAEHYSMIKTLRRPDVAMAVGVVLPISLAHVFIFKRVDRIVVLAASLLAPQLIADELFYGIYTSIAFLTAVPLGLDIIAEILQRRRTPTDAVSTKALPVCFVASLLIAAHSVGFIESPLRYPNDMRFGGMRLSVRHPYLTDEDKQAVMRAIRMHLADSSARRVAFWPPADGLLFWPEPKRDFLPYQPLFTETEPNVAVFRTTFYAPGWLKVWADEFWQRYGFDKGDLVRQRDGSEAWYVKAVRDR